MERKDFFHYSGPVALKDIAVLVGCEIVNAAQDFMIYDVQTLENARNEDISFFTNPRYMKDFESSKAGVCVTFAKYRSAAPKSMGLLISEYPSVAWAKIIDIFYQDLSSHSGVSNDTCIDKSAVIGRNCVIGHGACIQDGVVIEDGVRIGANTTIDRNVRIGKNTIIHQNATISHCIIGQNCIIHSGVRIGQDGFGFSVHAEQVVKIKHLGGVRIHDHVEIGANTCIDRGALGDTIIDENTKIDNLVQIAHNVVIGKNCFIAAQVGIAGSTQIGDFVMFGGQAGVAGHLVIQDHAIVAAQSGVMRDVLSGQAVGGSPAVSIKDWHKQTVALKKMIHK